MTADDTPPASGASEPAASFAAGLGLPVTDTAVQRALRAGAYPLPDEGTDSRLCFGLIADLADVLVEHDYPPPEPADFVRLMQLCFRFLYRPET
ncbi:hypothetical protein [Streptomyces sp. SD15]